MNEASVIAAAVTAVAGTTVSGATTVETLAAFRSVGFIISTYSQGVCIIIILNQC